MLLPPFLPPWIGFFHRIYHNFTEWAGKNTNKKWRVCVMLYSKLDEWRDQPIYCALMYGYTFLVLLMQYIRLFLFLFFFLSYFLVCFYYNFSRIVFYGLSLQLFAELPILCCKTSELLFCWCWFVCLIYADMCRLCSVCFISQNTDL